MKQNSIEGINDRWCEVQKKLPCKTSDPNNDNIMFYNNHATDTET